MLKIYVFVIRNPSHHASESQEEASVATNLRSKNCKLETELCLSKSENEDLRSRIHDVQVKLSAEVAVWRFQAEGLECDFLKKANAEISIWKLDSEMSKTKLAAARDELNTLR